MTDIVERLREYGGEDHAEPGSFHHRICWEAADEIERLRAALAEHEYFPSQQEIDDAAKGLAEYLEKENR